MLSKENSSISSEKRLIDPYSRPITYLRISVTDRCDFRCVYCMPEKMTFLPKSEVLSLEELSRICDAFIELGTKKIRITGGEPLVRKNILHFIKDVGQKVKNNTIDEITLTTNASQLSLFAEALYDAGIRRINVSLDSLDSDKFKMITRRGQLNKVIDGLEKAKQAGLKVKINMVVIKNINDHEVNDMIEWCGKHKFDLTLIEIMPMGDIDSGSEHHSRFSQYIPLSEVKEKLSEQWTLIDTTHNTGGPSRYSLIQETGQKIGFIAPLTHNFCASCNRVRVTSTGVLHTCLGQEGSIDMKQALRASKDNDLLIQTIEKAVSMKPKGHDFIINDKEAVSVSRYMSTTGG